MSPQVQSPDREGLDEPAETLLAKRLRGVQKHAPRTVQNLRADAVQEFRTYADLHGPPRSRRRHLLDADAFLRFLSAGRATDVDPVERVVLAFHANRRRFSLDYVRTELQGRQRHALLILWTDAQQRTRRRFVHLGF